MNKPVSMEVSLDANSVITSVVCLVLQDCTGAVLATQRPAYKRLGLMWEFPGGKIEAGENPESALIREIVEELCLKLEVVRPLPPVIHSYDFGHIRLHPFLSLCEKRPQFKLTEHIAACWISLENWASLHWAPADIPIIAYMLEKEIQL